MFYDYQEKKIVAVLAKNLEQGVALNVVGHLGVSLGAYGVDLMGRAVLKDADGENHAGIAKYPFVITKASAGQLKQCIAEAKNTPDVLVVDYPKQMLETAHDDELAQALERCESDGIEYLGAVMYGKREAVSLLTKKFSLWK